MDNPEASSRPRADRLPIPLLSRLRALAPETLLGVAFLSAAAGGTLAAIGVGGMAPGLLIVLAGVFALERGVLAIRARLRDAQRRQEDTARQLDRRISELFSLQELSYVLSESIQLDRIADQVARYAARFLQAEGALLALVEDPDGRRLRVAAASGTLAPLQGRTFEGSEAALVRSALARERIEVAQASAGPGVMLLGGTMVRSAAVAPLRAQGLPLGALAVADRRDGQFTTEDLWLLSTVATQTSVVVANSRLFEMVRRSTEEWETAFNALSEGLAVVGPEGRMLRANRALGELAGRSPRDLVGADFADAVADGATVARELPAAAQQDERPAPVELRVDRDRRVLRLTAAPLAGPARGAVVVLVEDVTGQRAMQSQLIHSEKMAAIGQLVSGVAHELNNPLTSIAGLSELLIQPGMLPESAPAREHLRVIHAQAERAGRIVRNLLTFARKGGQDRSAVDLNDVVSRTALLIAYDLQQRQVDLVRDLCPEPVIVHGDRQELQQVLLNLVMNAAQAMAGLEPGRTRRLTLATARERGEAVLRVTDTGPGVPPSQVAQLFTPFFTTKAPGQGTGLGLSLSYGMVEAYGGRISYEPGPDGGAEFTVRLPLQDAERPATPTRWVLVVDDDPGVHRLVHALFAPDGHIVAAARTGEQGLQLAAERSFDLIIADGRLSAGRHRRFVAALLAEHPEWRDRLIVAGAPRPSQGAAGGEPSAAYTITKPLQVRDLRRLVGDLLGTTSGPL
jgi:two-component system NtrC family sensor kinase